MVNVLKDNENHLRFIFFKLYNKINLKRINSSHSV